jgi:thiol-disulfide isomerase/thioredoxin
MRHISVTLPKRLLAHSTKRFIRTTLFAVFCAATFILFAGFTARAAVDPMHPYDESADGDKQIAEAVRTAARQNKHVLLDFGGNTCVPCLQLHRMFEADKSVSQALGSNFVVALIATTSRNEPLLDKYSKRVNFGIPFLIVLDARGKELTVSSCLDMVDGTNLVPGKIVAFLNEWSPKPQNELVAQMVRIYLHDEFSLNRPADDTWAELRPIVDFQSETIPLLLAQLTNGADNKMATNNARLNLRVCVALGVVEPGLWTNQPVAQERLLAEKLVDAFTQRPDHTFDTNISEFKALSRLGPETVPFLMAVAGGRTFDQARRIQAYWALGGLHILPEIVVPFLAGQFNTNRELLDFAAHAILQFGPDARLAIPALTKAFHQSDFWAAWSAVGVLAKVNPQDAEIPTSMGDWLRSEDVVHRRAAARVLADLGAAAKPAAPALSAAAQDSDETVRTFSLRALNHLGDSATSP